VGGKEGGRVRTDPGLLLLLGVLEEGLITLLVLDVHPTRAGREGGREGRKNE
jgi:hypothetical protein